MLKRNEEAHMKGVTACIYSDLLYCGWILRPNVSCSRRDNFAEENGKTNSDSPTLTVLVRRVQEHVKPYQDIAEVT